MRKDIETKSIFFNLSILRKTLLENSKELRIPIATNNRWNKFFKIDSALKGVNF